MSMVKHVVRKALPELDICGKSLFSVGWCGSQNLYSNETLLLFQRQLTHYDVPSSARQAIAGFPKFFRWGTKPKYFGWLIFFKKVSIKNLYLFVSISSVTLTIGNEP